MSLGKVAPDGLYKAPNALINLFPAAGGASEPRLISRDWPGVPRQVDAAMAGRIYISGSAPQSWARKQKSKRRNRKGYRSRRNRNHGRGRSQSPHRQSRSAWLSLFSSEEDSLATFNYDYDIDWLVPSTCEPIQSVYFFSGGEPMPSLELV